MFIVAFSYWPIPGGGYAFLLGLLYFLVIAFTNPTVQDVRYSCYLATKASQTSSKRGFRNQDFWHEKFKRHLRRAVKWNQPEDEGDLFVRIETRRVALARNKPMNVKQAPGLRTLLRAFDQASQRAVLLATEDSRRNNIAARMNRFLTCAEQSQDRLDALLDFLLDDYLAFDEEERKLIRTYREETWWDRHPTVVKGLVYAAAYAAAAAAGAFVLHILGVPLPIG